MSSATRQQQQQPMSIPSQLETDIKAYIAKAMDNLQLGRINEYPQEDIHLSEPIHRSSDKEEYRTLNGEDTNRGNDGNDSYPSRGVRDNQNQQHPGPRQFPSKTFQQNDNYDRRNWRSDLERRSARTLTVHRATIQNQIST